jgi:hypothetical protein
MARGGCADAGEVGLAVGRGKRVALGRIAGLPHCCAASGACAPS